MESTREVSTDRDRRLLKDERAIRKLKHGMQQERITAEHRQTHNWHTHRNAQNDRRKDERENIKVGIIFTKILSTSTRDKSVRYKFPSATFVQTGHSLVYK